MRAMSASILDSVVNSFGASILENLGKRLGISPAVVRAATPMIVGLVLSGIKRLTTRDGAADTYQSLMNGASNLVGSQDMDSFLQQTDPAKSTGLLDILTGDNSIEHVATNFAHKSGLDPQIDSDVAAKMLGMMAPAVLHQVDRYAKDHGLDMSGIASAIDDSSDALKSLGNLQSILDDSPGIADDIMRGLSKLFGRG
jgi:hypothetical protein